MSTFESSSVVFSPPESSECRALIHRVASSAQFSRSTRLRDFLRFVGQASPGPGSAEVNEHEIGVHVFGRSPNYDRSQDNIVRVNATELRKRVDRYFETEGLHEPIIFTIPRGSYLPRFEWRTPPINDAYAPPTSALPPEPAAKHTEREESLHSGGAPPGFRIGVSYLSIAVMLLLGTTVSWLAWQNRDLRMRADVRLQQPETIDFWSSFVKSAPQTDVVLPDASFIMADEILGKPLSLSDYTSRTFPGLRHGSGLSKDRQEDLEAIFAHNLVLFGDFTAAQHILAMSAFRPSIHLSFARFYEPDSIRRSNVIVIGGRKANPWAQLFDDQLNFALEHRHGHSPTQITNRHALPGEPGAYVPLSDSNHVAAWSVIACLPNLGVTGKVLLIAGTDSDATSAAADFLTSEAGLKSLRARLGVEHIGYFEAVLKTPRMNAAPFGAELVAVRRR